MKQLGRKLPDGPGVYFFLKRKEILYIGKATSLRDRVKSYFGKDLFETRGPKIVKMLELATSIDFKTTDSVLEALILEASLIKKHQPKGNSDEKDDKSFNYVVITKEDFPRVLVVRGKNLPEWTEETKESFGPFPHGLELREALKIIRRIFPFRDKCLPANYSGSTAEKQRLNRCFNAQIGLCPGVCSGEISKEEYGKLIRSISLLFQGRKKEILRGLEKHMKREAKVRNFEKAAEFRNKIFALTHINDIALLRREQRTRLGTLRVEAYDVAHISGTNTVGSMVVMEDGVLAKDEYKRFKIRTRTNDDPGSLEELLSRRFKHTKWRVPDLVVVDGGNVQLSIGQKYFKNVVGVVKDDKHKPIKILGDTAVVRDYHHDILALNAEAHRFALAYHRQLRKKELK